ncbi:MAG: MBOAT family protein [Candidatus Omnitrophota bacterium]
MLNHRWQNRMLLVASYVFYGTWDWRFLSLIWISTWVDYYIGNKIAGSADKIRSKKYMLVSIVVNLAFLGFFKYFNFFISSFIGLFSIFGVQLDYPTLKVILPVGISFYTFQSMSYTLDIYYGRLVPSKKFSDFALFVAFFPQLVAGPIERATHLLPQITNPRKLSLEKFYEGCYLILWGLFLKVFVADNLASIVDPIFMETTTFYKEQVLLGAYAFAFQIFCDFAGYSSIARGTALCMGFDIMHNFNIPYFAVNPSDFWRRWHISLSTWLKDYLYIPLGGNKGCPWKTFRNLMLTMLLGGLWHGASWTFVLWGAYHGVILILYRIVEPEVRNFCLKNKIIRAGLKVVGIILFFHIVCYGWILFRAQSFEQIMVMTKVLFCSRFTFSFLEWWNLFGGFIFYVWFLMVVQTYQYWKNDLMAVYKSHWLIKGVFYYLCIMMIIIYGVTDAKDFIYFQF